MVKDVPLCCQMNMCKDSKRGSQQELRNLHARNFCIRNEVPGLVGS